MSAWEYARLRFHATAEGWVAAWDGPSLRSSEPLGAASLQIMNRAGREGWELVTYAQELSYAREGGLTLGVVVLRPFIASHLWTFKRPLPA
jgi:hypothetical protein